MECVTISLSSLSRQCSLWGPTCFKNQTICLLFLWQTLSFTFASVCLQTFSQTVWMKDCRDCLLNKQVYYSVYFHSARWTDRTENNKVKLARQKYSNFSHAVLKRYMFLFSHWLARQPLLGSWIQHNQGLFPPFSIHPTLWSTAWIIFNDLRSIGLTCSTSSSTKLHASKKSCAFQHHSSFSSPNKMSDNDQHQALMGGEELFRRP